MNRLIGRDRTTGAHRIHGMDLVHGRQRQDDFIEDGHASANQAGVATLWSRMALQIL